MSRIVLLFIFSFSLMFAKTVEEFPFIGVSITTQTLNIKNQTDKKETTAAIRYGKQTLYWRTMFSYEFNNHFSSLSMEIDKILMNELFGNPEYRPYAGFVIGTINSNDVSPEDESGYFYGASVGMIVYTTDTMDLDLSYHYYKVEEFKNLDTIQGASAALHYFY